jgi:predicted nuclease of predicted toxin-antitoxin system
VRIQDAGLSGGSDPDVLEWAARENRVLLTHDFDTLIGYAWDRVRATLPMPGVVAVRQGMATGRVIEELVLIAGASEDGEWANQVSFVTSGDEH